LLLIDEAHLLPSRLLEELRLITEFTVAGEPCVRLVLAGCHELELKLAHPRLASLEQRIVARCVLEPLSGEEVRDYVHSQLVLVGGGASELFGSAALAAVARVTEGVPRLINQVCDHALILAYADGADSVSEAHVERAWADLQQLPILSLHRAEAVGAEQGCVIEFGRLEEEAAADVQTLEFPQPVAASPELRPADEQLLERCVADAHGAPSVAAGGDESSPVDETALDPFGGPYAEEEVVFDRYANYDDALFRTLPHVASQEGSFLGRLLEPSLAATALPRLALATAEQDDEESLPQIVVEDDPSEPHAGCCIHANAGAQCMEYDQLFSRLRG
jgi:hypothetical protein